MMKYKTRSLATALVNELVDTEACLRSNMRGRGKDQLDPKKKCFELYPSDKDSYVRIETGMTA